MSETMSTDTDPQHAPPATAGTDELRKWLELLWFEGFYEGKAGKGIERRDADVAEAVKGIESIPAAVAAEGAGEREIIRSALGLGPQTDLAKVLAHIHATLNELANARAALAGTGGNAGE